MGLPEHIERYLGRIDYGWRLRSDTAGFRVVKILNQPKDGVVTYCTLGMSSVVLQMPGGRSMRQELLFAAYDRYEPEKIASFLLTLGENLSLQGRALLRGDVIGPYKPLIPGISLDSVYCTMPVMHDEGLATYSGRTPHTVFVWLIPL
jgi:hypothetical protein